MRHSPSWFTRRNAVIASATLLLAAAVGVRPWLSRPRADAVYRIGYEHNPPNMVVGANGELSGLAIETVREAARRAGIRLQWVRYEGPGNPLAEGALELWPLMADVPGRRPKIHFTDPWLQTHYMVLYRAGGAAPAQDFQGNIGHYSQTLHGRLVRQQYPRARDLSFDTREAVLVGLCRGEVDAAFLEERAALRLSGKTDNGAAPCALESELLPQLLIRFSVASSLGASEVADRIREEIGEMARDGALTAHVSQYANEGVHDATAAFQWAQAEQRARLLTYAAAALMLVLIVVLWMYRLAQAARLSAERAALLLQAREAHFRTLLEHSADLILVIDGELRFKYISPSGPEIFGWKQGDLERFGLGELLHAEDRAAFEEAVRSMPAAEAPPTRVRLRLKHRGKEQGDGTHCTFQATVRRLPATGSEGEGTSGGVLINARDITGELRLQEQLQQAQKLEAMGRLAGGIAHDFNNQLTVINGYCELISRHFQEGGPVAEGIAHIRASSDQAALLTRQLLAFSRRQKIEPRVLDLNAVVSGTGGMLERLLGTQVHLVCSLNAETRPILADAGQMQQVVMNLALNARDAMPAGGTLRLETGNLYLSAEQAGQRALSPGGYAVLTVSDTGTGMDEATRLHIFEPFFTTKAAGKGTGLGLATVYGIVKQHHGAIEVESQPGKGSTFRILLAHSEKPVEAVAAGAGAGGRRGSETILLVEDQPEIRTLAGRILRSCNYDVLEAGSGEAALSLAGGHSGPIQLLLTDVRMPGMSGLALAVQLRAARPTVKVLYISGYAVDPGAAGPDAQFLAKPFTPQSLAAKVREVLDGAGPAAN